MQTYFATPERTAEQALGLEVEFVSKSPVMAGLLNSVGGLLTILDEHLQIVALNHSFLNMLGVDDPCSALGLRLGEALQCVHAHEEPAGCGTTKYCSSCGAAIAMVSGLEHDAPVERICALKACRGGKTVDIALLVRAHAICIERRKYLLVFLQDITKHQQWAALERTFFHDVNNMLSLLVNASELMLSETRSDLAKTVRDAALRLSKEVSIQRCLAESETGGYQPHLQEVDVGQVLGDLRLFFARHPAARGKQVEIEASLSQLTVTTDISLLLRVLYNMVINALEATPSGGAVRVWLERGARQLTFCAWNAQEIPEDVAKRIFQRNFSTKEQAGRGIGTFSMKFFGESILGGRVDFTTSKETGTVFRFSIPA